MVEIIIGNKDQSRWHVIQPRSVWWNSTASPHSDENACLDQKSIDMVSALCVAASTSMASDLATKLQCIVSHSTFLSNRKRRCHAGGILVHSSPRNHCGSCKGRSYSVWDVSPFVKFKEWSFLGSIVFNVTLFVEKKIKILGHGADCRKHVCKSISTPLGFWGLGSPKASLMLNPCYFSSLLRHALPWS
jgi:hypothetical protein